MHARLNPRPPSLSMPMFHFEADNNEFFPLNYDDADSIEEENEDYRVNLGSETPNSIMDHDYSPAQSLMSRSGIAANTGVLPRPRSWRSSSFRDKTPTQRASPASRDWLDRDCGICFEMTVVPCRTLCCGKLFCLEHLAEWLHGSASDGLCPSCRRPCTLVNDTLSLASPKLHATTISPCPPPPSRLSLHKSSPSVESDISSCSDSSSNDSMDRDYESDDEAQAVAFEANDLSEDALSRIAGKVLSIVALLVFFYALQQSKQQS